MREKSAHCPRRDSNLYLWDTRPLCFRLHHDGRHASRQSKQTLQTLTRQLDRETIMHETLQLLSAGPRRQASARTSAESDEACQRKTKDRADGMREKSAHCPRRDSNLYLWDTRPLCFRLHHDGRHASRQSKQTLRVCVCVFAKGALKTCSTQPTIKERGEEAHVRSAVQGLPHTSSPVSSSRSSCRVSTSLSFSIWFDVFTTSERNVNSLSSD